MSSGVLRVAALVLWAACSTSGGSADGAASGPDADNHAAELNACLAAIDNDPEVAKGYVAANVVASGFDASQLQFVYLVERQEGGSVLGAATGIAVGGTFGATLPRALKRNVPGELLWMAQRSASYFCDPASGDHAGYLHVDAADPPGNDAVKISLTDNHTTSTPRDGVLCDPQRPFAGMVRMEIEGTGFSDEGKTVRFFTVLGSGIWTGAGTAGITGGSVGNSFSQAYAEDTTQEVYWYVDRDGDHVCTKGIDHPGYVKTTAFRPAGQESFKVPITDNQIETTPRGVDVCAVMNLCVSKL